MSQTTDGPHGTTAPGGHAGGPAPGGRNPLRWVIVAVLVVIALLLAAVVALLLERRGPGADSGPADDGSATSAPVVSDRLSRADWDGTAVGVFRRTEPEEVAAYEEWLGRPVPIAADFSARGSWENITDPDYVFDAWADEDRRLTLGVAMLPNEVDDVSIQDGADGEYDEQWQQFGENLVEAGQEDAILRLGWEFNLDNWAWSTGDEDAWVSYYRRIVEQLDSVEGSEFRYDWNVNNADNRYDAVDYYPGDDVVDYIGVDAYDVDGDAYPYPDDCDGDCRSEVQQQAWDETVYGGDRGLRFWSGFAAEHDKQLSLPEWGVWDRKDGTGGEDNPYYVEQMADFIEDPDNAVGYQAYFENENGGGNHRLMEGDFPDAEAVYRERFGG